MRAEDVAREHQFREGFTLVDYAEVGLPIFRLTIEAVTTATRTIPTIHEFAMRCMALGEIDEADIARMLGLSDDIVRAAVDALVADGLVARTSVTEQGSSFALTPQGGDRLENEKLELAQEEMIVFDYDAIRRMPIRLAGENVVKAAELKSFGSVEIRPYPAEPPAVDQLSIPEVSRAIRRQAGDDFRRTVLALKRIVRRNNVFREAVALVFAADRGDEVQVGFAIDGKVSEAHERAFAENGGPRKMGFVKMVADGGTRRRLEKLVGRDAMKAMPAAARFREVRLEEAAAHLEVRSIEPAVEASTARRSASPALAALMAARERLAVACHNLDTMEVRPLACFEQRALLDEAFSKAKRSLIVTTAGLQSTILTPHMMRDLDRLLSEGVAIQIGSFLAPQLHPRGGDRYDPLAELTKRAQRSRMKMVQTSRAELFLLVQDEELAVVSNRPFLGDVVRRSGFQRVEGVVTRHRALVAHLSRLAVDACRPRTNG